MLVTVVLIVFDLYLFLRLPFTSSTQGDCTEPVSVIICAKNEKQNLLENLPAFLVQDYPHYEVLVVDDHSSDGTTKLLNQFQEKHLRLRVIRIDADDPTSNSPGKKAALQLGIEKASHDIVLLTDADCKPTTSQWIQGMTAPFHTSKVVLGYSPFRFKANIVSFVASWDNLETAMLYFGFALVGMPYMGVGRNLAYRKSWAKKFQTLGKDAGLASGDDDLMVGAMAKSGHTAIVTTKDHRTVSAPAYTMKEWWTQKRRHLTTATYYKPTVKFILGTYGLSKLLFYLLIPALLLLGTPLWVLYLIVIRAMLHALILVLNATRLQQWHLIVLYPFWECLSTCLLSVIHIFNYLKPRKAAWS